MVSVSRDLWFSGKRAGRKLTQEKELFFCFLGEEAEEEG